MIKKLLYLTYIPLENIPTSGSSVRPLKMKQALETIANNENIEIKTFGGISNNIYLRKKTVSKIKLLIKTWKPDACYIESPSGPLFYYGDVNLIKQIHNMNIPISIFYRDAYWKYSEFDLKNKIKSFIIKKMQKYQWNVFRKCIDLIYFPSLTMANEFECPYKDSLPPGSFVPRVKDKIILSKPLQFIFVGGAAKRYGIFSTISAFEEINKYNVVAKLFYICPDCQWNEIGIDEKKYKKWLEVIHISGDEKLKQYYENSDVAILLAPRSFYGDFAVPIKIFEYMSYLKPILVTDCIETAKIIDNNNIGWVVKDNKEEIVSKLKEICDNPSIVYEIKKHMENARANNLWIKRAEKVINDLNNIVK